MKRTLCLVLAAVLAITSFDAMAGRSSSSGSSRSYSSPSRSSNSGSTRRSFTSTPSIRSAPKPGVSPKPSVTPSPASAPVRPTVTTVYHHHTIYQPAYYGYSGAYNPGYGYHDHTMMNLMIGGIIGYEIAQSGNRSVAQPVRLEKHCEELRVKTFNELFADNIFDEHDWAILESVVNNCKDQ